MRVIIAKNDGTPLETLQFESPNTATGLDRAEMSSQIYSAVRRALEEEPDVIPLRPVSVLEYVEDVAAQRA